MSESISEREASAISIVLHYQNYNREFFIDLCPDRELTLVEYVVHVVSRFHENLSINGFDGFEDNTGAAYSHFLPIALAEIGANDFARLTRKALLLKYHEPETWRRINNEFFECREDLGALLYAYIDAHRDSLPKPPLDIGGVIDNHKRGIAEWSNIRQNGTAEQVAAWANKERPCPKCGTVFVSKFARGACPKCRHVFIAGST